MRNPLLDFLRGHTKKMLACFNLQHFEVVFRREKFPHKMEICVDYEYLEAQISYSSQVIDAWKRHQYQEILQWLAHELTHIITGELKTNHRMSKRTFYDERVTEHLGRLLFRLYIRENKL